MIPIMATAEQLLEYEKLKDEQSARIQSRDTLLNYNLVSIGILASIAATVSRPEVLLLVTPWISMSFGWAYLQHDEKITAIGRYLQRIDPSGVFAWEMSVKQVALSKKLHRAATLTVMLLDFTAPCIVGPIIWLHEFTKGPSLTAVIAGLEIAAGLFLGIVTVISSDFISRFDHREAIASSDQEDSTEGNSR